ncbi:MAG: PQQ-binding-like beta-propeller repeat protein [Cyclobacteriaceae bacterium]|nr:PQQ-binding-like beta-propeller repeat protein [Cyclobacteriaceae bacterium]
MIKSVKYLVVMALFFSLFFHFSSCKEEEILFDSNGVAIKLPHLWKTSISSSNNIIDVVVATPIIYEKDKLLVGADEDDKRTILSLNSADGSINWQWNDLLSLLSDPTYLDPITLYVETYFKNENRLFFNYSSSSYCLNLATGLTLWNYKTLNRSRFSINGGIDNTYFTSGSTYEPIGEEKIYYGSMMTSDEEQLLLAPEFTQVDNPVGTTLGRVTHITSFKNGGDIYLAFGMENPYTDFTTKEGMGATELNLYNITQSKYEYKKVVVNPNRGTRFIGDLTYQAPNLYFQSSNYIHGHDAMTGVELWKTHLGSAPLTSSMLLADNKLFSACEDRFLYCVDANTGNLLWKEQNTGTCSELSYLNGVLYYLGGGDGLLHAVDAETGKHLWKVSSPDLKENSGAWFYGLCVAVPGKNGSKGVVVATTGLNAYGYEAIR